MEPPRSWVLADDRPGNVNQALGVAEALGWPFTVKQIRYGRVAHLPNWLLAASTHGMMATARLELTPPWPELVIAAGRRTAPIARWVKRQQPSAFLAQIMWPGSARDFDLIAVPEHDRAKLGPEVLPTIGAPHRLTPAVLQGALPAITALVADLPRPRIACLVGGSSRRIPCTPEDARRLGAAASALAAEQGGSLLVTTSRRTGLACEDALAGALTAPHRLHRWSADGTNPYIGFMAAADAVIVTSDSASMATEAAATGKPVFLFTLAAGTRPKLDRLHQRLGELGYLRPLGSGWFEVDAPPLNSAAAIAAEIRNRLARRNGASPAGSLATDCCAS